jgi:hypothetical protein
MTGVVDDRIKAKYEICNIIISYCFYFICCSLFNNPSVTHQLYSINYCLESDEVV